MKHLRDDEKAAVEQEAREWASMGRGRAYSERTRHAVPLLATALDESRAEIVRLRRQRDSAREAEDMFGGHWDAEQAVTKRLRALLPLISDALDWREGCEGCEGCRRGPADVDKYPCCVCARIQEPDTDHYEPKGGDDE